MSLQGDLTVRLVHQAFRYSLVYKLSSVSCVRACQTGFDGFMNINVKSVTSLVQTDLTLSLTSLDPVWALYGGLGLELVLLLVQAQSHTGPCTLPPCTTLYSPWHPCHVHLRLGVTVAAVRHRGQSVH